MRGYSFTVGAALALLAGLLLLAHGLAAHPVAHVAPDLLPATMEVSR